MAVTSNIKIFSIIKTQNKLKEDIDELKPHSQYRAEVISRAEGLALSGTKQISVSNVDFIIPRTPKSLEIKAGFQVKYNDRFYEVESAHTSTSNNKYYEIRIRL